MTTDQKVVGSIPAGRVTKSLEYEANPNFWTDLKLYGLSSVFYRTQTI